MACARTPGGRGVAEEDGQNIRAFLGAFIGCTLVDVTQQDAEDFAVDRQARIYLHFSNGQIINVPIDDKGFNIEGIDDE